MVPVHPGEEGVRLEVVDAVLAQPKSKIYKRRSYFVEIGSIVCPKSLNLFLNTLHVRLANTS